MTQETKVIIPLSDPKRRTVPSSSPLLVSPAHFHTFFTNLRTFGFPLFLFSDSLLTTSMYSRVFFTTNQFSGTSPWDLIIFFCCSVGLFPFLICIRPFHLCFPFATTVSTFRSASFAVITAVPVEKSGLIC